VVRGSALAVHFAAFHACVWMIAFAHGFGPSTGGRTCGEEGVAWAAVRCNAAKLKTRHGGAGGALFATVFAAPTLGWHGLDADARLARSRPRCPARRLRCAGGERCYCITSCRAHA